MKNHKFGDINLIVADSDSMVRQGLKAAFFDDGFRNTRDTSRMSVVGDAVDNNAIDLIIAENELQDGELCQSMTDVVNRILEAPLSPDDKDPRLLPELSRAIKNSLDAEAAHDISDDISESLKEAQRRHV